MKSLPEIIRLKEKIEAELLSRPGVTAVDVGYKHVGGKPTDTLSIRVHVEKKKKSVAKAEAVPAEIEGVPTDVLEGIWEAHTFTNRKMVDEMEAQADTTKYTTLKGGISIGPRRSIGGFVYTGTLGCIVRDNATNQPMLLSNFHVMCVDNGWAIGDQMVQPSRVDGGVVTDVVGALQRQAFTNRVDGAISSLSGRPYVCEIHEIGKVAGKAVATLGMKVRKRGRTTGLTYGIVDGVAASVNVNYGPPFGVRPFSNQISIRPDLTKNASFGQKGDSGSVVVNEQNKVVGLYFAGNGTSGSANHIDDVLAALNIKICVAPVKNWIKDIKVESKEIRKDKFEKNEKREIKEWRKEVIKEKVEIRENIGPKLILENDPKGIAENPVIPGNPVLPTDPFQPGFPVNPVGPGFADVNFPSGGDPGTESPEYHRFRFSKVLKDMKDQKEKREIKEITKEIKDLKDSREYQQIPKWFQPVPWQGGFDIPGLNPGSLSPFIAGEYRPDLTTGALREEPDLAGYDLQALGEQMNKDAADAAQAKVVFDNEQSQG